MQENGGVKTSLAGCMGVDGSCEVISRSVKEVNGDDLKSSLKKFASRRHWLVWTAQQ